MFRTSSRVRSKSSSVSIRRPFFATEGAVRARSPFFSRPQTQMIQRMPESVQIPEEEEPQIQMQTVDTPVQRQNSLEEEEEVAQPKMLAAGSIQRMCAECEQEQEEQPRLQPKLTVGQPGDPYEQEADRMADQVVSQMASPQSRIVQPQRSAITPRITPLVMRQGQNSVGVSPQVEQGIQRSRGGGQVIAQPIRRSIEQAFAADFGGVRIHANSEADQLNRSLNAQAFTTGQDIYFKRGEYQPETKSGQQLLAHELTHVVQQNAHLQRKVGSAASKEGSTSGPIRQTVNGGGPIISRRVASRLTNCAVGVNGAPAAPVATLRNIDVQAMNMANLASLLISIETAFLSAGIGPNPASPVQRAYRTRFGLPPARSGGFLNRLTGQVRATQVQAMIEELTILARRFSLIARFFSGFLHYRCIGGAASFAGCAPPNCNNAFAWACGGVGVIFLCPLFWNQAGITQQQQATILIHEAAHAYWTRIGHGAAGAGGNWRHAECYASFVADILGFATPVAPCPAPPP